MAKKRLVIGAESSIKSLKMGKVSKIYLSNNCQKVIQADVERYAKIGKIDLEILNKSGEEIGVMCKKPFSISVLCVLGEAKK